MFDFLKKKQKEIIDYLPQSYFTTEEDTRKPTFEDKTDKKPTVDEWLTKNGYFGTSEKQITDAFPEMRPKPRLNEEQATKEINRLGTGTLGGFEYPIYRDEKDTYNLSKDSAFNRIVGTAEPEVAPEAVDPMTTGASRPMQGPRNATLFGEVLADPNNKITDPTDPNYFPPAPNSPDKPGGVPMTAQADPTAFPPAPSKPSLGLISGLFEKLGADSEEKRSALGNSLIKAGVAMMAPNGNNGMAAIGAGLDAGVKGYDDSMKVSNDLSKEGMVRARYERGVAKESAIEAADLEIANISNENPGAPLSQDQKSRIYSLLTKTGRFNEAQKLVGESTSTGDRYSKGERLYDPVTKKSYDTVFDKRLGRMVATDPVTGEMVDTSNMQIDSAGRGKQNMSDPFTKASREEEVQLGAAASDATSNIFNYDSMAELMKTSNEGGGLFGLLPSSAFKDKRIELERLGFNVAGDGAMSALNHFQANQMPAMIGTMKGMGPLSDKDIEMLSKQTLSGDLSPESFEIVREKLTKMERFKQQQYRDWKAYKKENPDQNYSEWKIDYQDQNYNDFMNDRTNGLTTKEYNEVKAANQGEIRTDAQGNRIRLKPGADRRDPASWERI